MIGRTFIAAAISLEALAAAAPAAARSLRPPWTMPPGDFGGAVPLNQGSWYSYKDYPKSAIRKDEQGVVTVTFTIGVDGRVGECRVSQGSGSRALDAVPCRLIEKRARFAPARDAQGAPRPTAGSSSMLFWLPDIR